LAINKYLGGNAIVNPRPASLTPSIDVENSAEGSESLGAEMRTPDYLSAADRILVIRLGAMGDVVRTLPAVRSLRRMFPGAHITWLVEPAASGVVESSGIVDESLVFPRPDLVASIRSGDGLLLTRQLGGFLLTLRRRRFDVVLDFHGILKSGLLARLCGAPIRYGYARGVAREFSEIFVNRRVVIPNSRISRFDRNAALVSALALDRSESKSIPSTPTQSGEVLRPLLKPSPLAESRLAARLRVSGSENSRNFVLLHPGTSPSARHKRYAASGWAEVARGLANSGVEVWLTSGKSLDERRLVDQIIQESGGGARPAPETHSFDDLLALLSRTSVFASADTGPLHAASLSGVSVVQLLGPTDPVHNQPWSGAPFERVHVPLPCAPCRRGCANVACMSVLTPRSVADAILGLHVGRSGGQDQVYIEQEG